MERARRKTRAQRERDAVGEHVVEAVVVDAQLGAGFDSLEALRQRLAEWVAQPRRPAARGKVERAFCWLEAEAVFGRRRRRQA